VKEFFPDTSSNILQAAITGIELPAGVCGKFVKIIVKDSW